MTSLEVVRTAVAAHRRDRAERVVLVIAGLKLIFLG
jgi:hypothetical protein